MIVIDASAILAVLANEPERNRLISMTTGTQLVAPASLPWEIGNALSAMIKRRRITVDQAQETVTAFHRISIRMVDVNLSRALALASRFGMYAYDAYFLECAQSMHLPLLTLDRELAAAARRALITVLDLNS